MANAAHISHLASQSGTQQLLAEFNPDWPPLLVLTEHSPPGEYLDENGQLTGATVNLVRHLMEQMGETGNMLLLPWARGLEMAKNRTNIALFETIRNNDRENQFKWVGPLKHYQISLYARTDRVKPRLSMQQLTQGYNVCANRGSVYANMLQDQGFIVNKNLVLTVNEDRCARMLVQQRVDLAPFNENTMQRLEASYAMGNVQLFPAILLTDIKLYIAFSKDVDDARILRWQQALETSYQDGTMRKLYTGVYTEQAIKRLEQFAAKQTLLSH
ncbi:substrate-binding periplasmic protein [Neptunicella sp. SCSIO 80796]|uniref:substrate-binding periplasmic protein n=1 Tax=Neptunicella plasticusilytica TaxID=3117012 RepID=UPI003A4D3EA8